MFGRRKPKQSDSLQKEYNQKIFEIGTFATQKEEIERTLSRLMHEERELRPRYLKALAASGVTMQRPLQPAPEPTPATEDSQPNEAVDSKGQ